MLQASNSIGVISSMQMSPTCLPDPSVAKKGHSLVSQLPGQVSGRQPGFNILQTFCSNGILLNTVWQLHSRGFKRIAGLGDEYSEVRGRSSVFQHRTRAARSLRM